MAETTEETTSTEAESAEGAEASSTDEAEQSSTNWQDKFEGQRKINRDLERKYKESTASAAALKAAAEGREAEHKAEQDNQRVRDEALTAANSRILKAEVRAAAAGKLADPADALRFLDLSSIEVGEDGDIDAATVAAAIDDLIKQKPYLAAQSGKRFQGSADGGARNENTKPAQLTGEDVKKLSPQQIVAAKNAGQLDDYLKS